MCGQSENAHTENEGLGRKGHYTTIVPLGRFHHNQYDNYEPPFNTISGRMVMKWFAEETERLWQSHLYSLREIA